MQQNSPNRKDQEEVPYLLDAVLISSRKQFKFLLGSWKLLSFLAMIGLLLGLGYWYIKHDTYTASTTFVVEDTKPSGGGIASALAGQLGLDLGGLGSGGSVLQGDNVLELLKSNSLLKKTLLTAYDSSNKISLADVYATSYGLKNKWENDKKIGRTISFAINSKTFSRVEDSLLHSMMKRIIEKELTISKPDKKLSLFSLQITTRDEKLSLLICERLLKVTTDFYIDTKTKRVRGNVERLQERVDSIKGLLNRKTLNSIDANRQLLDVNPAYAQSGELNVEVSGRDKMVQATIFAELTKSLETSKTSLLQETPTIQVVDNPELPLKKNEVILIEAMLLGAALSFITGAFMLIFFQPATQNSEN